MNAFDRGRAVADAVLFEGYALYPYRASSTKNQLRWQFGVLMPRAGTTHGDPWWLETQLLVAGEDARVRGKLRFLRLRRREVELLDGTPAESLDVDGQLLIPWDEGEVCEHDFDLSGTTIDLPGDRAQETVRNAAGEEVARVVRTRGPLSLRVTIDREPIAGGQKLRARLVNLASAAGSGSRNTPCRRERASLGRPSTRSMSAATRASVARACRFSSSVSMRVRRVRISSISVASKRSPGLSGATFGWS